VTSIVVSVRWGGAIEDAEVLAAEVRSAMERAAVAGGRLVGVGADGAAFGFDDGAAEEAIELAVMLVDHGGPTAHKWRVGVGIGSLAAVRDEDAFERLSVGTAAARAAALARVASPGEILVDAALPQAETGSLLSVGKRVANLGDGEGGKRLRGLLLDVNEPWRRAGEASLDRIHDPRVVGRESSIAMVESVEPGGLAIVRAAHGVGGTRFLEEIASRAARALLIEPTMCSVEPLGGLRHAFARSRGTRNRELPPREAELLDRLELGRGLDVSTASDLVSGWIGEGFGSSLDERAWILIDDASLVDRATLDAIGHAASVPGVAFAVVVRLDPGDVVPPSLGSMVVEADVTLKPLQPHEATVVLEEACGGKASVGPEVVRRWVRRGAGIPLAILESLRHGFSVGDLAVRSGLGGATIVARSKASGRGRVLSAHAWIVRRLAVLEADRAQDSMVAAIVAIAGAGVTQRVVAEAAVDLGVGGGAALQESIERLVREAVLVRWGELLAPSSRTLREAAMDRLDDKTRRRIHAALAGALAREASGLDLAEGAHHAALAGDQLGAAALAIRAADRARKAGLDEWGASLEVFARAQGGTTSPMPTTPSPPPRAPHAAAPEIVSLAPDELEDDEPPLTIRTPPPEVRPEVRIEEPKPEPRHTLGVSRLTTGQIAVLPAPYVPPTDLFANTRPLPEIEQPPLDRDSTELSPLRSSRTSVRPNGLDELAGAARQALAMHDFVALDAALEAIEVVGGPSSAVLRVRAIAALAQRRVADGLELARRATQRAETHGEQARAALVHSIALGVAGDRSAALSLAFAALSLERRRGASGLGERACRQLVERIVGPLSPPGPSAL